MNWLVLNPYTVAMMWVAAAALAVWLYLHTRRPLRRSVATLRFWNSVQSISQPRRRRIREPWALLAQLLFLLLVILALANPHWGAGRSVVIVLDTSIWSQARPQGEAPWIDGVRREALRILNALPSSDQVLLMSAEADVPPIMPFTTDRIALQRAIVGARSSSGIGDLPRALKIGQAALTNSDRGLLLYVGPGMIDGQQAQGIDDFRQQMEKVENAEVRLQFLVRIVGGPAPVENRGITRLDLQRDPAQPDRWQLLTQVKNYNDTKAQVTLKLLVNGQQFVQRSISLGADELASVETAFVWDQGGLLQAEISPPDELDSDNHATVAIPAFRPLRVALFANDPAFAKTVASVLASDPYLRTEIQSPGSSPKDTPDVAIYQGIKLPDRPAFNSIWFLGGGSGATSSPLLRITNWNPQHPATRWVRSNDVSIRNAVALHVLPTDTVLAATGGNPQVPLIVAREQQGYRLVIVGFDPRGANFQMQSAFPLLMAGSIEWMTHPVEEVVDSFSVGEIDLPDLVTRIIAPSGKDVPFGYDGHVHLLATETGVYRMIERSGETNIAVNTPLLPAQRLKPTVSEAALPETEAFLQIRQTLWRWLVVLAIIALWLEWQFFYWSTRKKQPAEN